MEVEDDSVLDCNVVFFYLEIYFFILDLLGDLFGIFDFFS